MNRAYIVYYSAFPSLATREVAVFFCEVQAKRFIEIAKRVWSVWITAGRNYEAMIKLLSAEEIIVANCGKIHDPAMYRMEIMPVPMASTPMDLSYDKSLDYKSL